MVRASWLSKVERAGELLRARRARPGAERDNGVVELHSRIGDRARDSARPRERSPVSERAPRGRTVPTRAADRCAPERWRTTSRWPGSAPERTGSATEVHRLE